MSSFPVFNDQSKQCEVGQVTLRAACNIGASGAITLERWIGTSRSYVDASTTGPSPGYRGIKTVTKLSTAGQYSFALSVGYNRLLRVSQTTTNATGISAAPDIAVLSTTNVGTGTPTIIVQMSTGGVATNPAASDVVVFEFVLDMSSVS